LNLPMERLKNKSNRLLEKGAVYPSISYDVVRYLQKQNMTLKEIGKLMGLGESFISRVLHKQRSFTLRDLSRLENAIGKPLPMILLEATEVNSVPKEFRKGYAAFRKVLSDLAGTVVRKPLSYTGG